MIDVVMVTFQRLAFTKRAISHLVDRTRTPFRLIVVDNGSTDGTRDYLWKSEHVAETVFLGDNYGIHWAKNRGLDRVSSPLYVDTDNDILVPQLDPDWLSQLIALLDAHPNYGAIALRPQVFVGSRGDMFDGSGPVKPMSHAGASMRLMRTGAIKAAGGWRQVKEPGRDNEERWIASKLKEQGYQVGYARDLRCWHIFGSDDNWGYGDLSMEVHGHRAIWPLPSTYDKIKCDPQTWEPIR